MQKYIVPSSSLSEQKGFTSSFIYVVTILAGVSILLLFVRIPAHNPWIFYIFTQLNERLNCLRRVPNFTVARKREKANTVLELQLELQSRSAAASEVILEVISTY